MCRWGCESMNTTFMCKWCGTWFCRECLRGAYPGLAKEALTCRVCNQKKCQGTKVDFLIRQPVTDDGKGGKSGSARTRSASPPKSASSKSSKGGKSAGKKSAGKKGGKKSAGKKKKKK
ncbi:uncharacterized protein LOC143290227 [Babylonia areolata]|uniref:uncharacterized protein LOC143290227 n=1 Tax=Babylonia areolata TaxID=304850 RepID=UPI003FD4AFC9